MLQRSLFDPTQPQSNKISIYVLELEDNKYYVGQAKNVEQRFTDHKKSKNGPNWTTKYKAIDILEVIPTNCISMNEAMKQETKTTIEYMKLFGIDNVRGGDFCNINKKEFLFKLAEHMPIMDLMPI